MKKVLVISYFFPPMGGGGVQRSAKFVKYFPEAGIEPVVLTATPRTYSILDDSLSKDIPENIKVYRTFSFEPSGRAKKFRADFSAGKTGGRSNFFKRALAFSLDGFSKMFLVPDAQIGWLPFAFFKGLRIIKQEKIEVIYATGNPFSAFLLARWLGKVAGKPVVLDFRDPWTLNDARVWPNGLRKYFEKSMEHKVVHFASKVICVSQGMTDDMLKAYPEEPSGKFVTITNGFDGREFENIAAKVRVEKPFKFTLAFTGTLLDYRDGTAPQDFYEVFASLIKENSSFAADTGAVFAGKLRKSDLDAISELGLKDHIVVKGYIAHEESVGLLLSADVLLFFLGDTSINRFVLTGKIFEYIGSKKPVLAVAPNGPASMLINELSAGYISLPGDKESLKKNILNLYNDHKSGKLEAFPFNAALIDRYSRKNLTVVLAELLKNIIKEK